MHVLSARIRTRLLGALLTCWLAPALAAAQGAPPVRLAVPELASQAAIIFRGTVLAVEHLPATSPDAVATVRVRFLVREAVRGAAAGQELTIREWQGLWDSGERYRVGQSVVLFLHAPSGELGLTSPVGGDAGRLLVDRYGMVELPTASSVRRAPESQEPTSPTEDWPRVRKALRMSPKQLLEAARRTVKE